MLLVCLIENWLTLEKKQSSQVPELWTSFASPARVSVPHENKSLSISPRVVVLTLPSPAHRGTQLEMLSTEPLNPFWRLGHCTGTGLCSCCVQKGHLKPHRKKILPHLLLGCNLKAFWREEAFARWCLSCGHLLTWHFFTLPGWLSLSLMLRKTRSH